MVKLVMIISLMGDFIVFTNTGGIISLAAFDEDGEIGDDHLARCSNRRLFLCHQHRGDNITCPVDEDIHQIFKRTIILIQL